MQEERLKNHPKADKIAVSEGKQRGNHVSDLSSALTLGIGVRRIQQILHSAPLLKYKKC